LNNLFALKTLYQDSKVEKNFGKEVKMLETYARCHPHIITVLSMFKHKEEYNFLFPWAHCDLGRYWERNQSVRDFSSVSWMIDQCVKITDAIRVIHNPPKQDALRPHEKLWGRHGDIKAENILLFGDEAWPNLVVADLGIGALHRLISRSEVQPKSISTTRTYRPPEVDMKTGKVSRAYDMWTLGCLFLDMLTWFLGNEEYRMRFQNERMSDKPHELQTDTYFEVRPDEQGIHVFMVKEAVTKVRKRS
jgi:serine/threonine protein kinase